MYVSQDRRVLQTGWRTHGHLRAFLSSIKQYQNLQLIQWQSKRKGGIRIYSWVKPKYTKGNIFILSVDSFSRGFWLGQMSVFNLPEFLLSKLILLELQYSKLALQDTVSISGPLYTKRWDKIIQSFQEIKTLYKNS